MDIAGKAAHRIDPHFLQPVIFGGEIGVNLGVARNPPAVLAQHVITEQILRMARRAGPHRDQEETGLFRNGLGDRMRHHLDFHRKGPRSLGGAHLLPNQFRAVERFAHGLEAARPRRL